MVIAAYTIGASQGYVYCRAEYPIAVKTLNIAIEQARNYGLLGDHIFGTDFSFDLEVRKGAGAFVCGEETALIRSIEGKRGEPYPKPPFPATQGVFGKPTNINNVENLISKTEDEMMKVRNLGRKSLEEVINKLAMMGLSLASDENN